MFCILTYFKFQVNFQLKTSNKITGNTDNVMVGDMENGIQGTMFKF